MEEFDQDRNAFLANKSSLSRSVKDTGNKFSFTNSFTKNNNESYLSRSFAQTRRKIKNSAA
jgi:hypothetical protein